MLSAAAAGCGSGWPRHGRLQPRYGHHAASPGMAATATLQACYGPRFSSVMAHGMCGSVATATLQPCNRAAGLQHESIISRGSSGGRYTHATAMLQPGHAVIGCRRGGCAATGTGSNSKNGSSWIRGGSSWSGAGGSGAAAGSFRGLLRPGAVAAATSLTRTTAGPSSPLTLSASPSSPRSLALNPSLKPAVIPRPTVPSAPSWGGRGDGDGAIWDRVSSEGYNAVVNAEYWATRPVTVLARLLRIGGWCSCCIFF